MVSTIAMNDNTARIESAKESPYATSIAGSRNVKIAVPVLQAPADIRCAHAVICVGNNSVGSMKVVEFGPMFPNRNEIPYNPMKSGVSNFNGVGAIANVRNTAPIAMKSTHRRVFLPTRSKLIWFSAIAEIHWY